MADPGDHPLPLSATPTLLWRLSSLAPLDRLVHQLNWKSLPGEPGWASPVLGPGDVPVTSSDSWSGRALDPRTQRHRQLLGSATHKEVASTASSEQSPPCEKQRVEPRNSCAQGEHWLQDPQGKQTQAHPGQTLGERRGPSDPAGASLQSVQCLKSWASLVA